MTLEVTHTVTNASIPCTIDFTFDWLDEGDVSIYKDGAVTAMPRNQWRYVTRQQVEILAGNFSLGSVFKLLRETQVSAPAVTYVPGASIRAQDLNDNHTQVRNVAEELQERSLKGTGAAMTGNLEFQGSAQIIFEGANTDANQTKLTAVEPSNNDNDIKFPDVSGFIPVLDAAPSGQITATVAELNTLDGVTASTAEINKLDGVTATTAELNTMAGITATTAELNKMDGVTASTTELNTVTGVTSNIQTQLDNKQPLDAELTELATMDATTASSLADLTSTEVQILDNLTTPTADLNLLQGLTATAAELNKLDACTTSTAELNKLTGVTTTPTEFNKLSGLSASTANLDITNNMTKSTTLVSSSDAEYPTSKAVADYVTTQLSAIDGFVAVADKAAVSGNSAAAVPSGVTISVADAGGIPVDNAGTATYSSSSGQVTITGIATPFRPGSGTLAIDAGVRLLIEGTGTAGSYTYHGSALKEQDLVNLSSDINDFGERYRVFNAGKTADSDTSNHAGDLCFDVPAQKMFVYDAPTGVAGSGSWGEVQSVGDFILIPDSELSNFTSATPSATATISNAPAVAQQIMLVINGVVQKASTGSGTPTEGFTLQGNVITLAAAPPANSSAFGIILGSSVNVGVVGPNTINTLQLVDDSVNNDKLDSTVGAEAVNTNVIRDDAVTSDKLADSLSTDADRAVTTNHIRDNAVTFAKMQNTTVNNRLLGAATAGTVGEVQVQTDMIANDAITEPKLGTANAGSTGQFLQKTASGIDWATVDTSIADDSITEPKLATDNAGSTGQYLQKTATGMDWAALVVPPAVPTGSVHMFAMASVPTDYIACDGQAVSRTTYAALFAVIGVTYGVGDGSTTFNVPDLRNYFVRGADPLGSRPVGMIEADATAVNGLSLTDPGHTHSLSKSNGQLTVASSNGRYGGNPPSSGNTNSATTGITLSSSDTETRPQNVALQYAIKT